MELVIGYEIGRRLLVKKLRYLFTLIVMMAISLVYSVPVYAIANPDTISFGTGTIPLYKVFENVIETDDMLFVAEGYVHYVVTPTDYTAEEAFIFEVLDATGTTTIISTSLNDYEDKPISIYLTSTQVTTLGLVSGTAYGLRITGNPVIFPSSVGNTVTAYLGASDYIDQSVATDDSNPLRDFLMVMAENIEANDTPVDAYIVDIQGVRYLTVTGGSIFLEGIPGLGTYCPILFQSALEVLSGDAPESTGTYAGVLNPQTQWGTTVANGLTTLGSFLGVNQAMAGSIILFVFVMFFAVFLYQKTESGVATLLFVSATPFLGAFLGLLPLAMAFIFTILIVILMGYFFFSRGAL